MRSVVFLPAEPVGWVEPASAQPPRRGNPAHPLSPRLSLRCLRRSVGRTQNTMRSVVFLPAISLEQIYLSVAETQGIPFGLSLRAKRSNLPQKVLETIPVEECGRAGTEYHAECGIPARHFLRPDLLFHRRNSDPLLWSVIAMPAKICRADSEYHAECGIPARHFLRPDLLFHRRNSDPLLWSVIAMPAKQAEAILLKN